MNFEFEGTLIEKYDTQQVNDRFRKREFVVENSREINGRTFSDCVKFQLTQDKCEIIEGMNVGDMVQVSFNIRGNKWERDGKVNYFNNLDAWRIQAKSSAPAASTPQTDPFDAGVPSGGEEDFTDDLPF